MSFAKGRTFTSIRNRAGGCVMLFFAAVAAVRFQESGGIFFLLLVFRDLIAAYFFLKRKESSSISQLRHSVLAYVSSGFSVVYFSQVPNTGEALMKVAGILAIAGFFLTTLATIELSGQMGVAPARRGERCTSGVYRLFKHPMYLGYGVAEFGMVLLNPTNAVIYCISIALYWARARIEDRVLSGSEIGGSGWLETR